MLDSPPPSPATRASRAHLADRPPGQRRRWIAAALVTLVGGCDLHDETGRPPRPLPLLPGAGRLLDTPRVSPRPRTGGAVVPRTTVALVEGYDAAARRARDDARRLVLVFKATWCRHSALLLTRTLTDPRIVARSPEAVWAVIDADREVEICRRFGVTAFPTVIAIDETGAETHRLVGKPSAGELAAVLDSPPASRPERIAGKPTDPPR